MKAANRLREVLSGQIPSWLRGFSIPAPILPVCAIVDILCWYFLFTTYNLLDHIENPSFAFDKIEGHYSSTAVQVTLFAFILLCITALLRTALLLQKTPLKPFHIFLLLLPILAGILAALFMYPVGGLDIFPYILKAKLRVVYNANPYMQVPLRAAPEDPFFPYDHFPHHTLSYGPLWTLLASLTFRITSALTGPHQLLPHVLAFKIQSILFLLGTGWLLWKFNPGRKGLLSVVFYMGNPLVLFELVANGHNDGMMAFFLIASILLLLRGRWESIPLYTSSLLVKPFPLIILPIMALFAIHRRVFSLKQLGMGSFAAAVLFTAAWYPFVDSPHVFEGILSGLQNANAIKTASVSSLLSEVLVTLEYPPAALTIQTITCIAIAVLAAFVLIGKYLRGEPLLRTIGITYLLFCALLTNLLPWYFMFFLAVSSLSSSWKDLAPGLGITFLSLGFYLFSIWAWYDAGMTTLGVHLFQALILTIPILIFSAVYLFSCRQNQTEPAVSGTPRQ